MMFSQRIRKLTGLGLRTFGLRIILMAVVMVSAWSALPAEAQTNRKTPSRRTTPKRSTSRDRSKATTPKPSRSYSGERALGTANEISSEENLELPPEERKYQFSIMDGSYADLLDAFSRMTGRGILGDPPAGKVTFIGSEVMSYDDLLSRIRKLLFKHPDQYYLQLKGNEYEVIRFNELVRELNEDRIFTTLESFQAANLSDEEAAMLYYTPEGSIAELEPIRDLMPDYFRATQFGNSNSIVIFGLVKDVVKYLNLIVVFGDGGEDPRDLRVFRLDKVGANQALTILKQMIDGFDPGKATRGKTPSPWGIDAFADEPMKRLIVKAVPSKINEIQELLPIIDVTTDPQGTPVTIKLTHIPVTEFVNLIKPIMTGSEAVRETTRRRRPRGKSSDGDAGATTTEDMTLIPRPATNELVVVTTEEKLAQIRELQQQFDQPRSRPNEIVTLEYGDNEQIIAKAEELIILEKAVSGDDSVLSLKPGFNNTIIVIGSGPDIEMAKRIISDLDQEIPGGAPSLHRVRLTNAAPTQVVAMLKAIDSGAPPTAAAVQPRNRKVRKDAKRRTSTTSPGEKFVGHDDTGLLYAWCTDLEWEEDYLPLIMEIDKDAVPVFDFKSVSVVYSDSTEVVRRIEEVLAARGVAEKVEMFPLEGHIEVLCDSQELFVQIEDLAKLFDIVDTDEQERIFTLKFKTPEEVMGVVRSLLLDGARGVRSTSRRRGTKTATPVKVEDVRMAVSGDNLIVYAPSKKMEEIARLIDRIDVPEDDAGVLRVFDFARGTDVRELANTLASFFPGSGVRAAARRGKQPPSQGTSDVLFIPQPASNRIVISAPEELFPKIEETIEMLRPDAGDTVSAQVRFFDVEDDAASMVQTVLKFMQMKYTEAIESGSLPETKAKGQEVLVEAAGDRLMVVAPAILMEEAEYVIGKLGEGTPDEEKILRQVELNKANADQMVTTMQAIISGASSGARPEGRRPRRNTKSKANANQPSSGNFDGLTITALPGGNAILLYGYPDSVDQAEAWIHQIDADSTGLTETKVFRFENKDVEAFADEIMTLFDSSGGTGKAAKKSGGEDDLFGFSSFMELGGPRKGKDIALVSDPMESTIVVTTTPPVMNQIEEHYALYESVDGEEPDLGKKKKDQTTPVNLYELKYCKDTYEASSSLDDLLDAVWRGPNRPYVDYIPYTNILTIDCLPDDYAKVEEYIKKYVDKQSSATETSRIMESVAGKPVTAEELVKWLQEQMPGVEVQVESLGPGDIEADEYLEELAPFKQPEEVSPHKKTEAASPYVAPACMSAILADILAQAEEVKEAVKDEAGEDKDAKQDVSSNDMRSALAGTDTAEESDDSGEEEEVRKPVVKIRYDNATGAIIVEGPSSEVGLIRDKIEEYKDDLEELDEKPEIRMYRLRYVDVRWAATVLESMYGTSQAAKAAAARAAAAARKNAQKQGGKAPNQPTPNPNDANKGKNTPTPAPQASTSSMRIFPDIAQQALLIRANRSEFPAIVRLLATIDRPLTSEDANAIKTIRLTKLNASEVEDLLRDLLGIGGRSARVTARATNNPAAAAAAAQQIQQQIQQFKTDDGSESINLAEEVKLSSNPATNTILVMGPEKAVKIVVDAINTLEGQEMPTREPRTFVLENADAQQIVRPLQELFRASGGGRRGNEGFDPNAINNPTVVVDERRNALIIDAYTIDFPKIEPLIEKLDQPGDEGDQVIDIALQFADAQQLARTLNSIYGKSSRGGSAKAVKIEGDSGTNTIFVSAPPELRDEIRKRIEDADKAAEQEATPVIIDLKLATPSLLAPKINEALGLNARRGSSRTTITADDSGRRLIVRGPSQVVEQIRQMANTFDQADKPVEVRVFTLKYAQAPEILEQMKKMVSDMLRILKQTGTKMDAFSASADPRTNSLIVMGGPTTFNLVEEVLSKLDIEAAQIQPIETLVIPLKKAKASDVARNINNTFKDRNKRGETQVKADSNGDVLIVRGTSNQLKEVQELINKLDEFMKEPPNPMIEKKYTLSFVKADDAKAQLDMFFRDRVNAFRSAGIKNIEPAQLSVTITPETMTKQIRVMASEDNHKKVVEILADIDQEEVTSAARDTVIYAMKYADPNQMNAAINNAFRKTGRVPEVDQVTCTVLWTTQAVAVTASPENQEKVKSLVEKIDIDTGQNNVREMVKLVHARASEIGNLINQTYRSSRSKTRTGQLPVQVTANDTLNMIILSGPQAEIDEAKLLITELDKEPSELSGRVVRTYKLLYADPGSTIGALNNAFPRVRGQRPEDVVSSSYAHGTSMLIINASEENQKKVAELLSEIDIEGSTRDTKIIKLEHADAQEVSRGLTQLLRSTTRTRRGDTSMQIFGDPRTNSLIVYATPEEFARVQLLVKELDVEEMISKDRDMVVYDIKYCDPNGVVNAINQSYRTRTRTNPKDQVTAVVEWATQSIIVTASEENQAKVKELIEKLDRDTGSGQMQEIYRIKHARASDLSRMLNDVYRSRSRDRRGRTPVTITANDELNIMILSGPQDEIEQAKVLLVELDQKPDVLTGRKPKVYQLKFADPSSTIGTLNSAFPRVRGQKPDDQVTIGYAWPSSLVVTASEDNQKKVEELLAKIDVAGTERTTHTLALKDANSDEVAQKLTQIYRATRRQARGDLPMQIISEPRTNSLLVYATDEEFIKIQAMVETIDVPPTSTDRLMKTYQIQYADPNGIVNAINQSFRTRGGRMSPKDEVTAVTEWATQSIIVTASEENQKKVEDLIKEIDVEGSQSRETKVVKLEFANAETLARTLSQSIRSSRSRRGDMARVSADSDTNSLIIYANEKEFGEFMPLIKTLDVKPDSEKQMIIRTFKLENADAWGVEDMITSIFGRNARNPRDRVTVSASWASNSVLIAASPENMERIEKVIEETDKKDATERTVRLVEVSYADASVVADTLNEMFGSGSSRGGGRRRWMGNTQQGLVISYAEGTDMLLIKANDKEFSEIEPVLKQLDTSEEDAGEVKVFTLKYVDAEEMQGILETCMAKNGSSGSNRRGSRRRSRSSGELIGDVRISVVTANNQIIVSGDEEGLTRAEEIIARIDVEAEDAATKPHIITLKYAMPSMIEPTLTQIFVESGGRGNNRRNSGSSTLAVPIIVADDLSNSLIVRANPSDYSQILDLVEELDNEDAESRGGIKMITVAQGVNVEDLATKLQELLDASADYEAQQMGSKAKPKKVTVTADVRTHSILLAGAPSMFATAEELIRQLEEKGPLGGKTGVVIRTKIPPEDVKNLVDDLKEGNNSSSGSSNRRRGSSNRNRRRR